MAVTITKPVADGDYAVSNKRVKVRKLVFSGNYATGGESVVASDVGLRRIDTVDINGGVAVATDLATAIPVFYDHSTSKFTFYEGSAAGTALSEKTNAEVYPTGCFIRAKFTGV